MRDYIMHFAFGLGFAGAGAVARGFCSHRRHQILVAVGLVAAEAAVMVNTVG